MLTFANKHEIQKAGRNDVISLVLITNVISFVLDRLQWPDDGVR